MNYVSRIDRLVLEADRAIETHARMAVLMTVLHTNMSTLKAMKQIEKAKQQAEEISRFCQGRND